MSRITACVEFTQSLSLDSMPETIKKWASRLGDAILIKGIELCKRY